MKIKLSEMLQERERIIKEYPNPNYSGYPSSIGSEKIINTIKENFNDWLNEDFYNTLIFTHNQIYINYLEHFLNNYDITLFKNNFLNLTKEQKHRLLYRFYNNRLPLKKRLSLVDFLYQECGFRESVNEYNHMGETIPMYESNKQIVKHVLDNGYDLSIVKKLLSKEDMEDMLKKYGWAWNEERLEEANKNAGLTAYEIAVKLNYRSRLDLLKPKISYEDEEKKLLNLLKLPTKKAFKELLILIKQKNNAIKNNVGVLKEILKEKEPKSKKTLLHYLIEYNEDELLKLFINLNLFDKNDLTTINHDYLFFSLIKMRPKCFKIILEEKFFNEKMMKENFASYFESLETRSSYVIISEKIIQILKNERIPLSKLQLIQFGILDNYELLEKSLSKKGTSETNNKNKI